jgi:hypothetical protein
MKSLLTFLFTFTFISLYAQDFLDGAKTFSNKKPIYITLKDGSEVVGTLSSIGRKKGLIKDITIEDSLGKETEYLPEKILKMYIAPSGADKFLQGYNDAFDLTKLEEDQSLNKAHIKNGYVLFESNEVMINDEKKTLLLQLLNPGFCSEIRVYFDPYAAETASAGIGGFKIAGGDAKSYYVKKGDAVAFKLQKKNYEDELKNLYGDVTNYKKVIMHEDDIRWFDFPKHIVKYTKAKSK